MSRLALTALLLLTGCAGDPVPPGAEPLPDGTTVAVRGHREVLLTGEVVLPRFQGERRPGLCLTVPAGVDTSQWRGAVFFLEGRHPGLDPGPPTLRVDDVVCFERPPVGGAEEPGDAPPRQLCGWVEDPYDGAVYRLPCRLVVLEPESPARGEILERVGRAVAGRFETSRTAFFATLEELARRAEGEGLPWLAARIDLIGVHYRLHEGDEADRRRAAAVLDALPSWTEAPAAAPLRGDALYLAGMAELERGRLEPAWQSFLEAGELYRQSLEANRLAAVNGQAMVLIRVGAVRDGLLRLERALASCREGRGGDPPPAGAGADGAPCAPLPHLDARGMAAWMVLLDPTAGTGELARAAAELDALHRQEALEPQERANHLVNLALLQARQGRDPTTALERATALADPEDSRRAELLAAWGHMTRALHELSRPRGDLAAATELCRRLTREAPTPRLDAWAHSCLGRIHERRGEPLAAAWMLGRALQLHGRATPARLGRLLPLGPGQRADDHYRAARVALELGQPDRAWRLLRALDHLPERGAEPDSTDGQGQLRGPEPTLETPPDPRRALAPLDAVEAMAPPATAPLADYRAFVLEDEIFLLHRRSVGSTVDGTEGTGTVGADSVSANTVSLTRRTPLPAGGLTELLADLRHALAHRTPDDGEWRRLLTPLAGALWPTEALGGDETGDAAGGGWAGKPPVILFALHGPLQEIPLDALPGEPDPATPAGARWLGEVAVPAVRPARLAGPVHHASETTEAPRPLVVLDPTGDLGTRRDRRELYQGSFPRSRTLVGNEARRTRVLEALPGAAWFHADTHGHFDPAFPERSSLTLADGELTVEDLTALAVDLGFANLSGCLTGRWPTSADSGRYGLAGMFASRGTGWVIASRSDLLNDLARDFNPAFYRRLAAGAPVPLAWHRALAEVRRNHPAAAWAALFLIRGSPPGGQSPMPATPFKMDEPSPAHPSPVSPVHVGAPQVRRPGTSLDTEARETPKQETRP